MTKSERKPLETQTYLPPRHSGSTEKKLEHSLFSALPLCPRVSVVDSPFDPGGFSKEALPDLVWVISAP